MNIKTQKTWRGKTAGQLLAEAEVCESRAGLMEIFVKEGVVAGHHPDGLLLSTFGGPVVVLTLSRLQNEQFCNLCERRDAIA